jgi:hypothetical protein
MGEVVDINENKPHLTGPAMCLQCGHKWVAVVPVGRLSAQCPSCNLDTGVFQGLVVPDEIYVCKCGCSTYFIASDGDAQCCRCGVTATF